MLSQSKDLRHREDWQHILTLGSLVKIPGLIHVCKIHTFRFADAWERLSGAEELP